MPITALGSKPLPATDDLPSKLSVETPRRDLTLQTQAGHFVRSERNCHASYRAEVMLVPNLEPDEELTLFKRLRESKGTDVAARNKLVSSYLKLVLKMASKYHRPHELGDLISAGSIGLMRAIKRFDPDKGFKLATYARQWIRAAINQHLKQGGLSTIEQLRRKQQLRRGNGSSSEKGPSWEDGPAGSSLKDIFLNDKNGDMWQDRLASDGADAMLAGKSNISRLLDHQKAILAAADMVCHGETLKEVVNRALLNDRECRIFHARHLVDEPVTREELSSEFGVSRERVRQIEVRAFEKVQKAAKSHPQLSAVWPGI